MPNLHKDDFCKSSFIITAISVLILLSAIVILFLYIWHSNPEQKDQIKSLYIMILLTSIYYYLELD
jgi:hypothetical protein